MSKLQIYFTIGAVIFLFCGGYVTGCNRAKTQYDAKLAELQQQATESDRKNLEKVLETERAYNEKVNELSQQAQSDISEIEKKYQSAVSELNLINSNSVYSDRCSADSSALPADTTTAAGTTATKSDRQRGQDLRSAKEDLLTIARDCDITASHYNELLKIYNSVRETNNQ